MSTIAAPTRHPIRSEHGQGHLRSRRRLTVAVGSLLMLAVLAGCGGQTLAGQSAGSGQPAGTGQPTGTGQQDESAQGGAYPHTLTNCGQQVTVSRRPERIVTIKSSATEAVLALGAGDRIVGTSAADGPLRTSTAPTPPVLSAEVPSAESVLDTAPDLIYAGWESNLTAKTAGDRSQLAQLGIATYVSPAACDPQYRPSPLTFDDVFAEIDDIATIIGAREQAHQLITSQRAELAAITPSTAHLDAVWYSSGKTTPYVGAGSGAPQMIMTAIGLNNVAADVDDSWTSMSWEAIAAADPDVIVLVDASWSTAQTKIKALQANPVTAQLAAVKASRYLTVDFAATQPGVGNVDATTDLAAQLARIGS